MGKVWVGIEVLDDVRICNDIGWELWMGTEVLDSNRSCNNLTENWKVRLRIYGKEGQCALDDRQS